MKYNTVLFYLVDWINPQPKSFQFSLSHSNPKFLSSTVVRETGTQLVYHLRLTIVLIVILTPFPSRASHVE